MKKIIAMLLALMMVFALVACGEKAPADTGANKPADTGASQPADTGAEKPEDTAPVEPTGEPIKIGHIADLTGTDALTGTEASRSIAFAAKYLGSIAGRPIEIVEADSQSSAAAAGDAARKLIEQDDVVCILGPNLIGHKAVVATVAQDAEIPALFYSPTPAMMMQDNDWVIGVAGCTPQMPTVMADYVYNELGYDKVYLMTKDDTGGYNYANPFIANYEALGGTILQEVYVPVPTADMAPYLQTLTDPEADAIVAWTSGSEAITFWNTWYGLGLYENLPVVGLFHGAFTDSFICDAIKGINPDLVELILGTPTPINYSYAIESEENASFVEAWTEEYGYLPVGNNQPGACVQTLALVKYAIESIDGNTESAALRDALLAADMVGPEGRLYFAEGAKGATKDVYVCCPAVVESDGSYNYEVLKVYEAVPAEGLVVG